MSQSVVPAVGIDLGTTFSVVAYLDSAGRPQTIPNSEGDLLTPSVVFFDRDSMIVGKEALKAGTLEPDRLARWVKRDMGCPVYSKPVNGEYLPPEVIQSLVLEKLRCDAERRLGPVTKAVITVPAYFNEPRRKATQDAGKIAGLEVLDIINEPTAAAIAYGVEQGFLTRSGESRQTERVLIYDLGGGTFDVTLMEIGGSKYTALATAGDVQLGGIDWDQRLADFFAEEFKAGHRGSDPRENPVSFQRLLREAEDAKRTLSARDQLNVTIEHAGEGARIAVSRSQFEELTRELVERTRFTINNLLRDAGQNWSHVTRVILVGGSTRMPMIREMLERESGLPIDNSVSEDEAVAHGAALYAGLLLASHPLSTAGMQVNNVNSHCLGVLGIEKLTGRPRNTVLIPRNTRLPARNVHQFRTHRENQHSVAVNVIEGGDASGNGATPIGKCVIRDLPPGLPEGTRVDVTFEYAINGRLSVQAAIPQIKKKAQIDIERASGLSPETMDAWFQQLHYNEKPEDRPV
jgi:molecular chaperone DnaK